MSITEVILIITLGYSPSGTTHVNMNVLEYKQPSWKECVVQRERVIDQDPSMFSYEALCVTRTRQPRSAK